MKYSKDRIQFIDYTIIYDRVDQKNGQRYPLQLRKLIDVTDGVFKGSYSGKIRGVIDLLF
ncbi:hypothetical protein FC89_GL002119 [Liquorilactobacillus ghanensis DSM 18630]|uniref:Uncharacterized protein n=1 Tax=Liquorilactobacillus ghanensis DSM 18630 TaxID=1423750 RepID=A0A0R1VQG8_9LACO|nr:hypothetical protein [Liquorilactobacillus ghanensis]KRM08007.1 hypothetical protein FC89_GL002119 [Liquorilactobacillus ghanensis DSM 18630]